MVLCVKMHLIIGVMILWDVRQQIDVILSYLIMCQARGNIVAQKLLFRSLSDLMWLLVILSLKFQKILL